MQFDSERKGIGHTFHDEANKATYKLITDEYTQIKSNRTNNNKLTHTITDANTRHAHYKSYQET